MEGNKQEYIEEVLLGMEKEKRKLKERIKKLDVLEEALLRSYKINKSKLLKENAIQQ